MVQNAERRGQGAGGREDALSRRFKEWGWFLVWAAAGAAIALGTIVFMVIALLPDLALVALIWSIRQARQSAFGIVSGFGLPLLFIAYLHREGPGTICARTATSVRCEEHLDPLPWLAVGAALLATGLAGQVGWGRRTHVS